MKVTPDVTSTNLRPLQKDAGRIESRKNSINSPSNRAVSQDLQQSLGNRLSMDRTLVDALTVAQVSTSLVQKAMVVSSRLRNIAAEALAGGGIDSTALQETVAQIPEGINRFGSTVQPPPRVPSERDIPGGETAFPASAIETLRSTAAGLAEGRAPGNEVFDRVDAQLREGETALQGRVESFRSEIYQATGVTMDENPSATVEQMAAAITGAPGNALTAQGNIIAEVAADLI